MFRASCLHLAARKGHSNVYAFIMEDLEDKNPKRSDGFTPLHLAARNGHLQVCKIICDNVEDTNPSSDNGETPINLASSKEYFEVVSFLQFINDVDEKIMLGFDLEQFFS